MMGHLYVGNKIAIVRGPAPRSQDDLYELVRDYQLKTVLNLHIGVKEIFKRTKNNELRWCNEVKVDLVSVPFDGLRIPSKPDVRLALKYLIEEKYHPIYVHCRHGVDRTGFLIAVYRMLAQARSFDEAFDDALIHGMHLPYRWIWKRELKSWEAK